LVSISEGRQDSGLPFAGCPAEDIVIEHAASLLVCFTQFPEMELVSLEPHRAANRGDKYVARPIAVRIPDIGYYDAGLNRFAQFLGTNHIV
jgi:hypothetical protein